MESEASPIALDEPGFREHCLILTPSQRTFAQLLQQWCRRPRKKVVIVSGGPGTGKSFLVKRTLKFLEAEQLRMGYTGRSAQAIGGRTIHSTVNLNFRGLVNDLENQLENEENLEKAIQASSEIVKEFNLKDDPSIVIVDEVSMISGWLSYWLLRFFLERTRKPLLFIAMGDKFQLMPVKSLHNWFHLTYDATWNVEKIDLVENKRFVPEYGKIIDTLRTFIEDGDEEGLFGFICQKYPVVENIDGEMLSQAGRAMASTNEWVNKFNSYYVKKMVQGPLVKVDDQPFRPGCIVYVTENGCSSVSNGTELSFDRLEKDHVICKTAAGEEIPITKGCRQKFPVVLGFAATVHRFQGDTIDAEKIIIHLGGNRNLNLAYTALSRVRSMDQVLALALG